MSVDPIDLLHFDERPTGRGARSGLVDRLRGLATPPREQPDLDDEQAELAVRLPASLVDLRQLVEQRVQRGVAGLAPGVFATEVERASATLRTQGFPVFGERTVPIDDAELALRTHYLVQQVERVLA